MKRKMYLAIAVAISVLAIAGCKDKDDTKTTAKAIAENDGIEQIDKPVKLSATETYEMVVSFDDEMSDYLVEQTIDDVIEAEAVTKAFAPTKAANMATLKIAKMERVFPDAGEYEALHRKAGLHKFYRITYERPVDKENAAKELLGMPSVETAHAPTPKKPCAVNLPFNDPYAKQYQWQYYNEGSLLNGFVKGCDINVVPVWKEYTGGTSNVIVAIVDEGIDASHEDLGAVMIPAGANGSKNFATSSSNIYKITPGDHGCHVAGIVGAINNNRKGVCGVAGGLDGTGGVKLLSCQIFGDKSGDSAAAIVWGADHGAVISQNSWGYNYDFNEDGQLTGSEASYARSATIDSDDKAAVDYFIKYAGCDSSGNQRSDSPMKGGVVIFAAGNDNFENGAPANYSPVIAVGAAGPDGKRAEYSNYGSWVDICAPGGEGNRFSSSTAYILSCSTVSDGSYVFMCGTSMACPMVSGVAALLVSYFGGQGFTNTQLKSMLLDNANPNIITTNGSKNIGPMVDAYAAFKNSIHENGAPTISTTYTGNYTVRTGGTLAIDYTATDPDNDVCTFSIEGGDGSSSVSSTGTNKCRLTINTAEKYAGKHTVTLKAVDGNGGEATLKVTYTISANNAPVVTSTNDGPVTVKVGGTLEIDYSATDADGDVCTFSLSGDASASIRSTGTNKCRLTVNTAVTYKGSHTATITADDGHGGKTTKSVTYSIVTSAKPEITTDYTGDYKVRVGQTLEIIYTVTDVDTPNVNVTLQSDGTSTLESLGNGRYKFSVNSLQIYSGAHTATIKADDGENDPVTVTISYRIVPNTKPTISTTYTGSYTVRTDQTPVEIEYSVKDADGDKCTVTFSGDGSSTLSEISEGKYKLTIKTDESYAGDHKVTITANDGFGGIASKDVEYTIKLNHAPTIKSTGSFDPEVAVGQDVKAYFTVADEDGDDLTVSLQGDGSATLNRPGTNDYSISINATKAYEGNHTVKLIVSDPYGKTGEISVSYRIYVNQPPVITQTYNGPNPLKWYETGSLTFKASDPEGKAGMTFTVTSSSTVSKPAVNGNTATVNIGDGKGGFVGTCTITATAKDWLGETTTEIFRYTVLENRAPIVRKEFGDQYLDMTKDEVKLELTDYFTDPDNENLTFSVVADDGTVVKARIDGTKLVLGGLKTGVANVTVTATDGLKKSVSQTLRAGAFNLSGGPVIAPNPVSGSFKIRLGEMSTVKVSIYSESKKLLRQVEGFSSIFEPLVVDVWTLAPGRYSVKIEYDGKTYNRDMTKL